MAFSNKVFVVTGATSGMGHDAAKYLISEGATVYITGRNEKTVTEAASLLGPKAIGIAGNAASIADSIKLFEAITANDHKLDGLFVNAGVSQFVPFEHTTEDIFDSLFNTNVKGAYFTIQKLLPVLKDGASIVLNGSSAIHRGFAANSAYSASKAAVNSFAKTLSRDLLPRRIRVNVINPGPISTNIGANAGLSPEAIEMVTKMMEQLVPLGRMGVAAEITGYVAFLLSDKSSFILGTELTIDGGMTQL